MTQLVIVAHAPLATALEVAALHTYPEHAGRLQPIDVAPDATLEAVQARVSAVLAVADETLVLCDVFGATPFNGSQLAVAGRRARIVTGANVAMLWRVLGSPDERLDALVERAVTGGVQGIIRVSGAAPQNQNPSPAGNDQDPGSHHQ
jgi:PTS system ascorbate-specific IIA component